MAAGPGSDKAIGVTLRLLSPQWQGGIEAKDVILTRAFEVIREDDPARIVTLGGDRP
jgi:hypothetical protein